MILKVISVTAVYSERMRTLPNVSERMRTHADNDNGNGNDNVKDNPNDNHKGNPKEKSLRKERKGEDK